METGRVKDLEINQDLEWQRKSWHFQRAGWVGMLLLLVAAGIGAFGGDGPLREAHAGSETIVEYDRFTRFGSPTELEVVPAPGAISDSRLEVGIKAAYWGDFAVGSVTPEPDSVRAADGEVVYTFLSGSDPERVSFRLTPTESGVQRAAVRIGHGEPLEFTQIVYP